MKKVIKFALISLIFCCSLFCGCVPACGGIGWFTSEKKLRGQLDGLAEYLAAPENYVISVQRYEGYYEPKADELKRSEVYWALYLFAADGVYYYQFDFKTGGAAHYADGVLKNYYDGSETLTEGSTGVVEWAPGFIEAIRGELLKPVQNNRKGYHYLFFDYDFISYSNETDAEFDGVEFTAFAANFHVYKDEPKFRSYSLSLRSFETVYELYDNISGLTADTIAQRYEYFKERGHL